MEPVDVRVKDPDKVVWVPPRLLSQREEQIVDELVKMVAITPSTRPFNIRLWLFSRRPRAGCALISETSISMLRIVIIRCHVFESC